MSRKSFLTTLPKIQERRTIRASDRSSVDLDMHVRALKRLEVVVQACRKSLKQIYDAVKNSEKALAMALLGALVDWIRENENANEAL